MARPIKDSVVVITGASSGIGRATALLFAEQGAKVVVVARNEQALSQVCEACENLGGEALSCPCDVTSEDQVRQVAQRAIDKYGRIDVWVNNAAITLFGRFEDTPPDDWRRIMETNLFGCVYGARAVLPYFREQGSGVLINVSSVVGKAAFPYVTAYSTSKFAIRGFSEALRVELRDSGIGVCTVYPATIDTPIYQHGANYTGKVIKAMPPIYRPELVAAAILACARRPRPEISVGTMGQGVMVPHAISRRLSDVLIGRLVEYNQFDQSTPAPRTQGNLYEPDREWTSVSGNWTSRQPEQRHMAVGIGAAIALVVPAIFAGYLISRSLRSGKSKPTMMDRISGVHLPHLHMPHLHMPHLRREKRPRGMMETLARGLGLRKASRREHLTERVSGIGTALLASGLAKHLTSGQLRSAASDVRRYGRNLSEGAYNQYERGGRAVSNMHSRGSRLYDDLHDRGEHLSSRVSGLGSAMVGSRAGRAARNMPTSVRRELERRVCPPTPMQRIRRALGV
jgi:NAD(P)-dependent dehydrogenase (short-subunit alcohol dehydrogenase family)